MRNDVTTIIVVMYMIVVSYLMRKSTVFVGVIAGIAKALEIYFKVGRFVVLYELPSPYIVWPEFMHLPSSSVHYHAV